MNTRMAVPIASAVSFWLRVGDDMPWFLRLDRGPPGASVVGSGQAGSGSATRRDRRRRRGREIGAELGREGLERGVGIGAVGGEDDLRSRPDRQPEDRDQALRVGRPIAEADRHAAPNRLATWTNRAAGGHGDPPDR